MTDSQRWFLLVSAGLVALLVYLLAPVFTPFLVAALIAYLGDPLADRFERLGLSRTMAVIVVFVVVILIFTAALVVLVPLIERQITYLIGRLPDYMGWIQTTLMPWLHARFGIDPASLDLQSLQDALTKHWQQAGGIAAQVVRSVSSSGLALLAWLANLILIPVVGFYLLRDWDALMQRIRTLIPRRWEPLVVQLARESDDVLGAFLRGQLLVMLALGMIYILGLWMTGLKLALLIGLLAGLVSFVPYLGFITGILAAGVAIVAQTQDLYQLVWVLLVFGIGQLLEGTVLTPMLVGDRIGLHPVAVIFAILAGGQLFGFFGILLALPVAAVLAVLLRYVHRRYLDSRLYEESGS